MAACPKCGGYPTHKEKKYTYYIWQGEVRRFRLRRCKKCGPYDTPASFLVIEVQAGEADRFRLLSLSGLTGGHLPGRSYHPLLSTLRPIAADTALDQGLLPRAFPAPLVKA